MKLHKKTLLIFLFLLICLTSLSALVSTILISQELSKIEKYEAISQNEKIELILRSELSNLERTNIDWAYWDDTYKFINDYNEEYIISNLHDDTFQTLQLNSMIFVNSSNEIVFAKSYDWIRGKELPFSDELRKIVSSLSTNSSDISGFISLSDGPSFITSKNILRSSRLGPARGKLIFIKSIGKYETEYLSSINKNPVYIFTEKDISTEKKEDIISSSLLLKEGHFVIPINNNTVSCYKALKDIYGNPTIFLRVDIGREIYKLGVLSISYILIIIFIIELFFVVGFFIFVDRDILKRLSKLTQEVDIITETNDKSKKLVVKGNDEISSLAHHINNMLDNIVKSQNLLESSEKKYRTIVEGQTEFITRFLPDTTHTFVNDAFCKFFDIKKEDILGRKITDTFTSFLVPEEDMKILIEHFRSFDYNNPIKNIEHRFIFPDGRIKWVEWTDKAIFNENGEIVEFQSSGRDITERKRLEDEIKLLYNAIEQAPSIVAITDKEGKLEYVNTKFVETTGYTISEVVGKNPRILKSGFLPEEYYEKLWDTIAAGNIWRGEFQNRKKDGTLYWESASIAPVKNSAGEIKHYVKVSEDITYKKLAEQELKEKEETLRGILSAAPVGVNYSVDRIIKWTNYAMTEITGYPENELVGKNTRFLYINEEEYERVGDIIQKGKNEITKIETKFLTKEREIIEVLLLSRSLNPYDLSKGFITIVSDITKEKKSQKQLEENIEYFAHLVDNIRNPLAIISGFAQAEIENQKTKERIIRQVDRIEELIKQLDQGWLDTENTRKFLNSYL